MLVYNGTCYFVHREKAAERVNAQMCVMQAIRIDVDYISYGPHGRTAHSQHVILPVHYSVNPISNAQWRK